MLRHVVSLALAAATLAAQSYDVHEVFVEKADGLRPPLVADVFATRLSPEHRTWPGDAEAVVGSPRTAKRAELERRVQGRGEHPYLGLRTQSSNYRSTQTHALPDDRPVVILHAARIVGGGPQGARGRFYVLCRPVPPEAPPLELLDADAICALVVRAALVDDRTGGLSTLSAMQLLASVPVAAHCSPADCRRLMRAGELLSPGAEEPYGLSEDLSARVRLVAGDLEVARTWLRDLDPREQAVRRRLGLGRETRTSLLASLYSYDDPRSRGLIAWLAATGGDADAAFVGWLDDAVAAGELILPGDSEQQVRNERRLRAMRTRRDVTGAILAVVGGAGLMAAVVFLLRRVARRAVA